MIIYPLFIFILLLSAFVIVYRKAYILESGSSQVVKERPDEPRIEPKKPEKKNQALDRAEKLFKKKKYISAEKWYIEAAKTDPKNDTIYSRLGVIYIEQKNYIDAIDALSESIKYNQAAGTRWYNLSYAQHHAGRLDEAIDSAKRAVRTDPTSNKYKKWLEQLKKQPH